MTNENEPILSPGEALTQPAPILANAVPNDVPVVAPNDADTILLVPVRNMVLFPTVVLPVVVSRPRSIATIQEAVQKPQQIGLILQRDGKVEDPSRADLYDVGTVAEIVRYLTAPDGKHHAICQGQQRFRLLEILEPAPEQRGWRARIQRIEEVPGDHKHLEPRFLAVKQQAGEVLQLSPGAPEDLVNAVANITSPANLCDMVATFLDISVADKQELLETFDVEKRLEKIGAQLGRLSQVLQLSQKIRAETKGTLDKAQREYFLREQLRQIQKELDGEDGGGELGPLKRALDKAELPPEARKEADRELVRLERMNEASSEYSTTRTYLDVLSELPWSVKTLDNLDLARARQIEIVQRLHRPRQFRQDVQVRARRRVLRRGFVHAFEAHQFAVGFFPRFGRELSFVERALERSELAASVLAVQFLLDLAQLLAQEILALRLVQRALRLGANLLRQL